MIDSTIKNIKKYFKTLKKYLQQKYQEIKNTLQGFGGGIYSKNSGIKFFYFFLYSLYLKGLDIKNGSNISWKIQ